MDAITAVNKSINKFLNAIIISNEQKIKRRSTTKKKSINSKSRKSIINSISIIGNHKHIKEKS
jgi:hypothetical protein